MQVSQSVNAGTATVSLSGRFDFSATKEFHSGYETIINAPGIQVIDIDFGGVDYLDSSALGMLLIMKERAAMKSLKLRLTRCHGTVRQILDIANFGKIFTLT